MTKVLALVDGSIYAASVCDLAAWAAGQMATGVELLHVLGRRDTSSAPADLSGNLNADQRDELLTELAALDERRAKLALRRGRLLLDDARARLDSLGISEVTTKLRHGDLLETTAEFEAAADLIVIGKRGEAADFAKGHLGSNFERIVRSSRVPILVAARASRPIRRFLLAYDGGPSAEKAVEYPLKSSLLRNLQCDILIVSSEREAQERLDSVAARLRAAGFDVIAELRQGNADKAIANKAEGDAIDLLVMGAYGHGRIRTLFIGSTTTSMVRRCRIPVLLFR